ncbi:metallophosphoesterase family protein [Roseivirga pacifica]
MKRRNWLKQTGLAVGASAVAPMAVATTAHKKVALKVAHITDVHITPDAVSRFQACLEEIVKKHRVDFFLNGGDSIMAADYSDITRDRVTELWAAWDEGIAGVKKKFEVHSCLGNHDMWWAAPNKSDKMYGKDYVVERLGISKRYYSFDKAGWHFVILDGNNDGTTLDAAQMEWLKADLDALAPNTPVVMMSHYPATGVGPHLVGGAHGDFKELKDLFWKHNDKVKAFLSGHNHLDDYAVYNGVQYCCNGAMSGFWWGEGDKESAGKGYYLETPPGYAILTLYADGTFENEYIPHTY